MGLMAQREFRVDKKKNFSEWYNSIIYAADLVDVRYNVQGFIVHKPWSFLSIREIYKLFEKELEEDAHLPCLFPLLIPEENFEKEKEHVEGFKPNVFWVTRGGSEEFKRALALRPTSETAMYQMYALWVKSHADLPLKLYQSNAVYRFEAETSPFIRGREFLWIEAHDVFATDAETRKQIETDVKINETVLHEKLGIPFMVFQRPQWDKFPGAEETIACDALMPDGKALQISTTHVLGQNFSKPFGIKFIDAKGEQHYAWQTCFGPGVWRIFAALLGVHGDDHGLVFPFSVAPLQAIIIPIPGKSEEKVEKKCMELKKELRAQGLRVETDFSEKTPGFKFNYWEMKGVPFRIEVGEKELKQGTVTVARRDTKERVKVKEKNLVKELCAQAEKMLDDLRKKAENELRQSIHEARFLKELKKVLEEEKGFVRTAFCSTGLDGKNCSDILQAETGGGKVRGTLFGKKEKPDEKCVVCGKAASAVVYVAKQY
jgi:prolyl-tRNA synthetase